MLFFLHFRWNQISVFIVYHLPQFFSWFIFLLALTKAAVPFWRTIFLTHCCWWRWGRWWRCSISIHDRPNLQIFRNPESQFNALSHTHTQTHTMLLVTEALARGWLKINSVVCGAEEEVAPARNHMMQETGSDKTNASAEWRVPLWLVAALFWGFAQLVCFSFPVSFGAFGVVYSSTRPLSVFTVTQGGGKPLSCSLSCCL